MPIKADVHLHSNFSGDCEATIDSMVEKGIELGLTHMCFTEHLDIDYVYEKPEDEGMFDLNVDSYLYDLLRVKSKYKDKITLLFGIELGLQPHLMRPLAIAAKTHDFDFIIGSSHLCHRKDPYLPSFFEGRSEDEAHREYFESVLENVKKISNYDVYGHLDYVLRYGPTANASYSYRKHADILDEILKTLIDKEKGLEYNTGGFYKGLTGEDPYVDILKRYRELGGEIITIGSDAHEPAYVGFGLEKAAETLLACGFRYYTVFDGRLPEYFPIK